MIKNAFMFLLLVILFSDIPSLSFVVPYELLEQEQELFSGNVAKLIEYIEKKGYKVTLGEAYRTHEQALIYAHKKLGIVNSLHCVRLAIDLNIFSPKGLLLRTFNDIKPFGVYWENLNKDNRWGGRFRRLVDVCHFEMEKER